VDPDQGNIINKKEEELNYKENRNILIISYNKKCLLNIPKKKNKKEGNTFNISTITEILKGKLDLFLQ
jgi:hypothetical protein